MEFDKTNQNVTEFGIVDFLLNEPARTAAAVPKCFYYQIDHWTGSIVQGGQPTLWHWDGKYFFDKAKGMGGVHVANFTIGGVPADPSLLPGFPSEFSPYFGPGEGGAYVTLGAGDPGMRRQGGHACKGAESLPAHRPLDGIGGGLQQLRQEENLGRFAGLLSRREVLQRATALGLGASRHLRTARSRTHLRL